jgi:glucose-1-phosphate cytidylyltransferase
MTGGRLQRVAEYLDDDEPFCFTYGDGLSDVNITQSIVFHRSHGKLATVTGVMPPGRFGALELAGEKVTTFKEKPLGDGSMINGGFFVLSKKVLDYIDGPSTVWEQEPLGNLASDGELMAYEHRGFWHPMDTLRDKQYLEQLWSTDKAPWRTWDE